jgi:rare lipoprotein A
MKLTTIIILITVSLVVPAWAEITDASYYTVASCIKESGQAITASGERLKDDGFTCASWDYPVGAMLRVSRIGSDRVVTVRVNDRGPAKGLYRRGRKIDLSKAAFKALSPLSKGVIRVEVERI